MPKRITLIIVVMMSGCGSHAPIQPNPVALASDGVAGIVAHTNSAERHVQNAMPHSNATGKVQLAAASDEHKEVLLSAEQVKAALNDAQKQIGDLDERLSRSKIDYQWLEARWYVRWGQWVERALWMIGLSWLVLGAVSIILGIGNPLGWGYRLGKEITRLVPAMNPFSWIRDWIRNAKGTVPPEVVA